MESIRNVLRPRAKQLATNEIGALGSQQPQGGPSDPSNLAGHGAGTYGFERKRPATEAHTVDSEPKRHASLQENLFPKKQILGLRVLYNPGNPLVDIVFVHGLTGNSYRTWLHEDEGVYWPVHLLSKDIPDARILVFGYDADVTKFLDPVGQNNLRDHASCLVGDLAALRNQDKCTDRKIIFIVHSLGGLVTKKALCLSEQAFEPHLHQLDRHTIAIAFMGTPHRGSGLAPFASGIANILKACQMRVNREILKLLERDSEVLADVEASFAIWLRRNGSRFNLTCFFEELELRTVVHKESAKIEGWPQFSIRANHMDMTKFAIAEDMGYQRICGELTRWLDPLRTPAGSPGLLHPQKAL
ncbi:MAG: hypothetical protein M1816_000192 [Peltula sp. TS41687]|nr:MAG: hypothetical protein M1816_000192 [Peltula sp. TS41687]